MQIKKREVIFPLQNLSENQKRTAKRPTRRRIRKTTRRSTTTKSVDVEIVSSALLPVFFSSSSFQRIQRPLENFSRLQSWQSLGEIVYVTIHRPTAVDGAHSTPAPSKFRAFKGAQFGCSLFNFSIAACSLVRIVSLLQNAPCIYNFNPAT